MSAPHASRFGLYVHIPFCVHKCSYCDFYSFTRYGKEDFSTLTDRLLEDARQGALAAGTPTAATLFFGGGTPSLLPPPLIGRLIEGLREVFPFADDAEVTLEANPETVTPEIVRGWREVGVNRVSLGAQSFSPVNLELLERLGSPESIRRAAAVLRGEGFGNFSLDFIFGIPGQDTAAVLSDLQEALALEPRHLSFYNLTLTKGHPLHGRLPDEDTCAELYEAGGAYLEERGYRLYEISNFAPPGWESRHNLLYWSGGDYLGLGPSAASRLFRDGRFHHRKELADFGRYRQGAAPWAFEPTTRYQTVLEAAFLELRKRWGVHLPTFGARYGYDLTAARQFGRFRDEGLIFREGDELRLSPRGRMLADWVTRELVDDPPSGQA